MSDLWAVLMQKTRSIVSPLLLLLFLLTPCLVLGAEIALTDEEQDWLRENPVIRVAPDSAYAPYEYFDESDNFRGIASDYLSLLESRLGIKFQILRTKSWDESLSLLRNGQAEMASTIAENANRKQYLSFTRPYLKIPTIIMVRNDDLRDYELYDLAGKDVGTVSSYAIHDYLRTKHPALRIRQVPDVATGLNMLSNAQLDAMVGARTTLLYYQHDEKIRNLRIAGTDDFILEYAMASRKDLPLLRSILDKAIASIPSTEAIETQSRWIPSSTYIQEESSAEQEDISIERNRAWQGEIALLIIFGSTLTVLLLWLIRQRRKYLANASFKMMNWKRILAVMSLFIIVVTGSAFYALSHLEEQSRDEVGSVLQVMLKGTQKNIRLWMEENQLRTQRIANSPEFIRYSKELLALPLEQQTITGNRAFNQLTHFLGSTEGELARDGFFLIDPDGLVIASDQKKFIGNSNPISEQRPAYIERVLNKETVVVPGILVDSKPVVFFTAPVIDYRRKVAAILALKIPITGSRVSFDIRRLGDTAETYAFDNNGMMISPSRFEAELKEIGLLRADQSSILGIRISNPGYDLSKGLKEPVSADAPLTLMVREALRGKKGLNTEGYTGYRGTKCFWRMDLGPQTTDWLCFGN
jgi:ABC-type amino acid transport substrate-binding protein